MNHRLRSRRMKASGQFQRHKHHHKRSSTDSAFPPWYLATAIESCGQWYGMAWHGMSRAERRRRQRHKRARDRCTRVVESWINCARSEERKRRESLVCLVLHTRDAVRGGAVVGCRCNHARQKQAAKLSVSQQRTRRQISSRCCQPKL
jgi:hypothetical protein